MTVCRRAAAVACALAVTFTAPQASFAVEPDPQAPSSPAEPASVEVSVPGLPMPAGTVDPYAEVRKLKPELRAAVFSARTASAEAYAARQRSLSANAFATWAIGRAQDADTAAAEAQARARETQLSVDRWAVAAYQSGATSVWDLEVLQGESVDTLLHLTGLADSVGDYQSWLLSEARDAAAAATQALEIAEQARAEAALAVERAAAEEATAVAAYEQAAAEVEELKERLDSERERARALRAALASQLALAAPLILNIPVTGSMLERASALKDMRPFAPGSGPNSTERMGEWAAWDPTVVPGTPRAYAVSQLREYNWGLPQWPCLDRMWWHESGWRTTSYDAMQGEGFSPSRTWGIPQANPASKMGNVDQNGGPDWATNPVTQINWGMWYIKEYYGSPCQAWDAWRQRAATGSYGWY